VRTPAKGSKCQALFDFKGASEEDLGFKKGEVLIIENTSEDPNWWLAVNMQGKRGMIPANYVETLGEAAAAQAKTATLPKGIGQALQPMAWFHGKISRELAETLLTPREPGLYLVRESTNYPGDYTLCVCSEEIGIVDHYRIQGKDGKITVDEETFFDSLEALIKHYEKDSDGLSARLTRPLVKKGGLELVDTKIFAAWEIPRRAVVRVKQIGSGQFGDVFEGTYGGKQVAIKTLKNVDEESTRSFLAEAGVMTMLKHPNLVELIGVVTNGSPVMIISEFMSKGCLLDFLRSRGRSVITPEVQIKFARNIIAAMVFLESKNFVHSDLAARNILLTRKVSTSQSDVWSFGVTIWEIYSFGRAPYPKMGQKEVVENIMKGYRMEIPEGCSKDVYEKLMLACWDIDPGKRPTFKKLETIAAKLL